jgi:DnaJ-class molecular chaperone
MAREDLYKLLEVDPKARIEVIEAAYRAMTQASHPDKPTNEGDLQQRLNDAMDTMRDGNERAKYDRQLNRDKKKPSFSERIPEKKLLFYEFIKDLRAIRKLQRQGHVLADGTPFSEAMALAALEVRFEDFSKDFVLGGTNRQIEIKNPDLPFFYDILDPYEAR